LALFCLAMAAAMHSYAGGSWLHPQASTHLFWENFWCDLLREPAHNGLPNGPSVSLAMLGFVAIAVALGPFWLEVSQLLPARRARFVRVAGVVSAIATAIVALLPSDRFPSVHPPAVLTAGGLGFACACICSAHALARYRALPIFAASSLLLLGAAGLNLALYVRAIYFTAGESIVMPAAQKVATLALVVWMVAGLAAAKTWKSVHLARPESR
jgi:hypothetical protein